MIQFGFGGGEMTWAKFKTKWKNNPGKESAASQEHFADLCRLLGHPTPNDPESIGTGFEFQKGAKKADGSDGWADVWKRHFFAWEYKGKHKNLDKAYGQLLLYRGNLENPPLLVVSDIERILIKTNWTNTPTEEHEIRLEDIDSPSSLSQLKALLFDPEELKPKETRDDITVKAVRQVSKIASRKRDNEIELTRLSKFLDRCVFCFFAEDIGLLPKDIFTNLINSCQADPDRFRKRAAEFFQTMAKGGDYGNDRLKWFNGDLFEGDDVPPIDIHDLTLLAKAGVQNWKNIDPRIFGTLFQEVLEQRQERAALGGHYTKEKDIEKLVKPVVMAPLEDLWTEIQHGIAELLGTDRVGLFPDDKTWHRVEVDNSERKEVEKRLLAFRSRLASMTVLDPACGSGNFLYVALRLLKDLEKLVVNYAARFDIDLMGDEVTPRQLYGIEKSEYAWQLAQLTVWIAYLQWRIENGFEDVPEPVLRTQDTFAPHDAIVGEDGSIPDWPEVEAIISNPPFLGGKKMRKELGDEYVDALFETWDNHVARESDLCCYWFEKARAHIEDGKAKRVGLLATQAIRGGANRKVLKRIKETGDIFFAISDQVWYEVTGDAHVQISMVGFDDGSEQRRTLNGKKVDAINSNLTAGVDLTKAVPLNQNKGICFMGTTKGGDFDIPYEKPGTLDMDVDTAAQMLWEPNPHGRPNSDVLVPWVNASDVTGRLRNMWIVDFGVDRIEEDSALYEAPFEYAKRHVLPVRAKSRTTIATWWLHERRREDMRLAVGANKRYVITGRVTKHRFFSWLDAVIQPDSATFAFARDDDYFFGILHSRFHELWALATGTQLREKESGFRYTPETCFDAFACPFNGRGMDRRLAALSDFATTGDGKDEALVAAVKKYLASSPIKGFKQKELVSVVKIARAAYDLHALRDRYLNPPEAMTERVIEFPASVDGPWKLHILPGSVDKKTGVGTACYSWLVPKSTAHAAAPDDKHGKALRVRTLTELYNENPTWLDNAHRKLDEAVAETYGLDPGMSDEELLSELLRMNKSIAG